MDQLQAENKKLRDMVEDVDYLKKKVQVSLLCYC